MPGVFEKSNEARMAEEKRVRQRTVGGKVGELMGPRLR